MAEVVAKHGILQMVRTDRYSYEVQIVAPPMTPAEEESARQVLAVYVEQYEKRLFADDSWLGTPARKSSPCDTCPRRMGMICGCVT